MTKCFLIAFLTAASMVGVLILAPPPAAAQSSAPPPPRAKWIRDFSGVWAANGIGRSSVLPGEEVSLTKFGAEQYNKIDEADSPAYRCEPHGPTRMMTSAEDIMIVQNEDTLIVVSEHINDGYRIVYINGKHPDDMAYPEWNGTFGGPLGRRYARCGYHWHESGFLARYARACSTVTKLHVVERFTKTSPDTFALKVTVDDPVYFTKPFSYGIDSTAG